MGTAVLGTVGFVTEPTATPGEQSLLAYTAVSGTMSLTNAPSGSTGMRLRIRVINNTATGTVTIAGNDINGNSITETTPTIPIPAPGGQNPYVAGFDYVTTHVYGSSTATSNAITTSGITNGSLYVGGVQDAKYLIPCDFDFDVHHDMYSPDEFRGSYDKDFEDLQLRRIATIDKFDQDAYPETSLLFWHMIVSSSPVVTTLPATPTVLKASTAVSGGPFSLTSQPLAPGQVLQFVTTSVGASGTIVITGTDINGNAQTETLTIPNVAAGTYYSAYVYKTVGSSGVAFTGLTSGSVAINGAYGFQWVFTPGATSAPLTGAFSFFTGTDSGVLPFVALEEVTLEYSPDKAARLSGKGIAQDWLPIGDRTTTSLTSNRITSLGQPTDAPWVGTWSQIWIDDAATGTVGTTLYSDLMTNKIDFKHPVEGKWTSMLSQVYNRIRRKKRETTASLSIEFTDQLQYEVYRKNKRQYYQYQLIGKNIGGGNTKSITIKAAAKYEKLKRKPGVEADSVEADVDLRFLYDSTLGASYVVTIVNQAAPTYVS